MRIPKTHGLGLGRSFCDRILRQIVTKETFNRFRGCDGLTPVVGGPDCCELMERCADRYDYYLHVEERGVFGKLGRGSKGVGPFLTR